MRWFVSMLCCLVCPALWVFSDGNKLKSAQLSSAYCVRIKTQVDLLVLSRGAAARADADHHTGPGDGGGTGLESGVRAPSPRAQWDDRETPRKAEIHQ